MIGAKDPVKGQVLHPIRLGEERGTLVWIIGIVLGRGVACINCMRNCRRSEKTFCVVGDCPDLPGIFNQVPIALLVLNDGLSKDHETIVGSSKSCCVFSCRFSFTEDDALRAQGLGKIWKVVSGQGGKRQSSA